jgi:hypothetical protein
LPRTLSAPAATTRHSSRTALYFKAVRGTEWRNADPREVMSANFSSAGGWRANVARKLEERGLLPMQGGADCDT